MNALNRTTYYIEENGWFTSSLKPVSKEAFKRHQAEKRVASYSITKIIQTLAMGILAATQSVRFPMRGTATGVQVAIHTLSLHLWPQIPLAYAQNTTLIPTATTAPPGPQGDEFQVNTYTFGDQEEPSVASLEGRGFVVTWKSNNQDKSGYGVYGQRFDETGTKIGSEFLINTFTAGNQHDSTVAALSGGGFVVTWGSEDQDGSGSGVFAQRFDDSGATVGSEFQLNTYVTSWQGDPSVAALAGGGFVVTWDSDGQEGSGYEIYGQRFDGLGANVGSEFLINTFTASKQHNSNVAALAGGGFVVTWQSWNQDGSRNGVYGQRLDKQGTKVGNEFQVNTYTTDGQRNSGVAALEGGGFVVTWMSEAQDGSNFGVYGQRFDEAGAKVGGEFQVNTYTKNMQWKPSVAALARGGFVIIWASDTQDGSIQGVYGQRFNEAGAKVGSEFQVNTYTTKSQLHPRVASLPGGEFVVTWQSRGQDGSGFGVYGRIFPENQISTVEPTMTRKSSAGSTTSPLQIKDSSNSPISTTRAEIQESSEVTTSVMSSTYPSTRHLIMQTSKPEADRERSSKHSASQTPLIAGVAAGVAALASSLLAGGLFFWRRKNADEKPPQDAQVETENGNYQMLPTRQSHYKEWPKGAPPNDDSHYHQNIEELNQQMAQEYGDVSCPQKGDYDIIATSDYREMPQDSIKEMASARA